MSFCLGRKISIYGQHSAQGCTSLRSYRPRPRTLPVVPPFVSPVLKVGRLQRPLLYQYLTLPILVPAKSPMLAMYAPRLIHFHPSKASTLSACLPFNSQPATQYHSPWWRRSLEHNLPAQTSATLDRQNFEGGKGEKTVVSITPQRQRGLCCPIPVFVFLLSSPPNTVQRHTRLRPRKSWWRAE
ncbi:hypothetical protein GE09DRAFT_768236 [Coniochaeta sp. 2T2.1]|nr:hypothetical protein GE09DRAFT_768236 [Coniochaeta sp. 2T2.1]